MSSRSPENVFCTRHRRPRAQLLGYLLLSSLAVWCTPQPGQAQDDFVRQWDAGVILEVAQRVTISAPVDGFIDTFDLRIGHGVEKEQVMLQLHTRELELELDSATKQYEALLIQAENEGPEKSMAAREEAARRELELYTQANQRISSSLPGHTIPEAELVRVHSTLKQAEAEREGAMNNRRQALAEADAKKSEMNRLEYMVERSVIRCPFAGILADRLRNPGEYVRKGEPIAELFGMEWLIASAFAEVSMLPPERAVGRVLEMSFENQDAPNKRIEVLARIERVAPEVDADGRYRVFAKIANQRDPKTGQWKLRPGMVGGLNFLEGVETSSPQEELAR